MKKVCPLHLVANAFGYKAEVGDCRGITLDGNNES